MAIKPRSRAHEDRIRALEGRVEALDSQCEYFADEMKDHARMLVSLRAQLSKRRPWYKRIFGL